MTPKEELIEALKQLCKREGGAVAVAEAAGVNDQTLYQILKGIKLPSGEPRGVGPGLQKKIEAAFPGWRTLGSSAPPRANIPAPAPGVALDFKTAAFLAAHAWDNEEERELLVTFCHVVAQKLDKMAESARNVKTGTPL
jgi:hypothetical protein